MDYHKLEKKMLLETIEERASEYAYTEWVSDLVDVAKESYTKGATEQKAIDIENAKNAFYRTCEWLSTYTWFNDLAKEFIKALEE